MTLFAKQFQCAIQITLGETLAEVFDPSRELSSRRLQRCFDSDVHGVSPDLVVFVQLAPQQGSGHLRESTIAEPLQPYCSGLDPEICHDSGKGG